MLSTWETVVFRPRNTPMLCMLRQQLILAKSGSLKTPSVCKPSTDDLLTSQTAKKYTTHRINTQLAHPSLVSAVKFEEILCQNDFWCPNKPKTWREAWRIREKRVSRFHEINRVEPGDDFEILASLETNFSPIKCSWDIANQRWAPSIEQQSKSIRISRIFSKQTKTQTD